MKIILHNPSHNGDQLHTLGIVKRLIDDNVDTQFTIVPACSMYLFHDLLSDRVTLENHPVLWEDDKNIFLDSNYISNDHNILWSYQQGNVYINIWKLLVENNHNCISLVNRATFIRETFQDIKNKTNIFLNFNCNNYKELIPSLPTLPLIEIESIKKKINSYDKKIIFFYNQNSKCGLESIYTSNFNESIIEKLIEKYGDTSYILLTKPSNISHDSLLNVETEFSSFPTLDGKNLIVNAYIATLSYKVYFKVNGGSLFILNTANIIDSENGLKYTLLGNNGYYNIINNEYGLLCSNEL
jgi:hypothetical protein